jgi:hypothetical protein
MDYKFPRFRLSGLFNSSPKYSKKTGTEIWTALEFFCFLQAAPVFFLGLELNLFPDPHHKLVLV